VHEHHRHREAHGGDVERAERAQPQFLLHSARRHQPEPEACLDQPLLGGEAVDGHDLGLGQPERGQPLGQQLRVRFAG